MMLTTECDVLVLVREMKALQQRAFGASSERRARDTGDGEKQKPTPPDGVSEQKSLPLEEDTHELPEEERVCKTCGKPLVECTGKTEDHEEVDVVERRFVLRKHKRKIYSCECGSEIVARGPLRLPGAGRYSIAFAVEVAFENFFSCNSPTCYCAPFATTPPLRSHVCRRRSCKTS